MRDLRARTEGIFQLTSDGLRHYVDAVDAHFARSIHFARLVKLYSTPDISGPYWFGATSRVTGISKRPARTPQPRFVSISHIERLNLSVRMHLRRWVAWCNFVSVNRAVRCTPAMQAGLTGTILTMLDLLTVQV
jgi:hypothetical protein